VVEVLPEGRQMKLIPLIAIVAIVPLIVYLKFVPTGEAQEFYQSDTVGDLFFYWKQIAFGVFSFLSACVVMICEVKQDNDEKGMLWGC